MSWSDHTAREAHNNSDPTHNRHIMRCNVFFSTEFHGGVGAALGQGRCKAGGGLAPCVGVVGALGGVILLVFYNCLDDLRCFFGAGGGPRLLRGWWCPCGCYFASFYSVWYEFDFF